MLVVTLLAPALTTGRAQAADLQSEIARRIDPAPVVSGDFEQRRSLKGFRNPLVSQGEFLLSRNRGVVWDTKRPFASSLVITRERLVARRADGSIATQMDAAQEPVLRLVNELMFALLAGDIGALGRRFSVSGELLGGQAWRLALVPTDALLAGQFEAIDLEGASHVTSVRLAERNGDVTQVRFSNIHVAAALGPDGERRFEVPRGG